MNDTARMPALWGLLAEFATAEQLVAAAQRLRDAGYRRLDAYSPFPIEGLADALRIRRVARQVARITLLGGLIGAGGGYLMQYYLMAVDYPINVGGRPLHSWPAFIPVTFELMVLSASIFATVGLFALNRLPQPHHPLFRAVPFARAAYDGLFVSVQADDRRFDFDRTRGLLYMLGAISVTEVLDE